MVVPALDNLEVAEARFETHTFPLHAHDEYVVASLVQGAKRSRHGSRDLVADPGNLMLFNPYEEHTSAGVSAAWQIRCVYPTIRHLEKWCGETEGSGQVPRFATPLAADRLGAMFVANLFSVLRGSYGSIDAESAFVALLSHLIDRHGSANEKTRPAPQMLRARDLLDSSLDRNVTLSELAALEQVSPVVALRGFRKAYGCTPRVYLTARRIARAKRDLRAGKSLAEVAATMCFCDQSHLTRVFKRWTGMTPGNFARA